MVPYNVGIINNNTFLIVILKYIHLYVATIGTYLKKKKLIRN